MRILQILSMYHPEGEKILFNNSEVIKINGYETANIIKSLHRVDGIVLRAPASINKEIIDNATSVKVISGAGVGLDNIDVEYATKKGIAVLHAPKTNITATAEHTVGLMFALLKQIVPYHQDMMKGNFQIRNEFYPFELAEKNLGLVGWGAIARKVAEICKFGLNMNIRAYVRNITDEKAKEAERIGVKLLTNIDDIFADSDLISVHIPLTKSTEKMINHHHFSLMKKTSYFINTARGGVVNDEHLYECLATNKIAGAGLDVFPQEPPPNDYPFYKLKNIIMTPHIGGITKEAARVSSVIVASNVIGFLNGEKPKYIANPEVLIR